MWNCFKNCVAKVLPGAGWVTLALITGGLIALMLTPAVREGTLVGAALGAAILKIIGVSIGSTAIGTLLGCLWDCI